MSDHERNLLISTIAIVVSIGLGYFFLRPQLQAYHEKSIRAQALAIDVQTLEDRMAQIEKLEKDFITYRSQLDQLRVAAPPSEDYPELLVQLQTLADRSGVTISSITPGRNVEAVDSVPITLTVRSSFPQMLDFAQRIEKNLRPATVKSVSLIDGTEATGDEPLNGTIQLDFARTAAAGGQS